MKTIIKTIALLGLLSGPTAHLKAELLVRDDLLVYDTDLNITWLRDVTSRGRMTFAQAGAYCDELNMGHFRGGGNWRLPSIPVTDQGCSRQFSTGFGCTGSELGHMYYVSLGNQAGTPPQGGLQNRGPFSNLYADIYWAGFVNASGEAYFFNFFNGLQDFGPTGSQHYAWLVHDGDLAPPKAKMCFPPHKGVPGSPNPPEIDGRVQEDVGWRGAQRITYGTGTDPGHVAFQALRHSTDPYLYLSFEIRNDPTFDDDDVVVIIFRPNAASGTPGDDRRIFVFPLCDGEGAAGPDCNLTTPDDKIDRSPRLVQLWKDSNNWTALSSGQPTNLEAKVRSYPDGSSMAWNFEIKVPTSVGAGGAEWVDFADDFLFYFNVIRVSSLDGTTTEFHWPRDAPEVNGDISIYSFSPSEWGEGTKSNTERCKGVWIESSDIGTSNTPVSSIKFTSPPNTYTNTFFANVHNDVEIDGIAQPAEDVFVRFRIANWGIPGPNDWADIPATNPGCPDPSFKSNPTCPQDISAAVADVPGTQTFNLKWKVADSDLPDYEAHPHQCILAELDSWANTNITTKSVYRNMDFVNASAFSRSAEVSARGYGAPPEGMSAHRFALYVTTRKSTSNERIDKEKDEKQRVSVLNWAAHGYRYLGRSIIIDDHKYDIVDPVGSFAYVVRHIGLVKGWRYRITGAEPSRPHLYELAIPHEEATTIVTVIEPVEYYSKWSLSLHSGVAIPMDSFADNFDPGFNVLLDVGYYLVPQLALVAYCGYNDFKSKIAGIDDNYWINLSANLKYYQPVSGPWSVYIGGGPGYYIPETGDSEFGVNAGLGLDYEYTPRLSFELGADYHVLFDQDVSFIHCHAGVIVRF